MGAAAQLVAIELVEGLDDRSHLGDRAPAEIPAAAMDGTTRAGDFGPNEPLVGQDQPALARLGEDAAVGRVTPDEVARPDARVFLVRDQGDQHATVQPASGELGGAGHHGGRSALHVVTATSVHTPGFKAWLERVDGHAGGADGVQVRAEHERRALGVPDLAHRVGASRHGLFQPRFDSGGVQPLARELRDALLTERLVRRDRWIDGGDAYQILQDLQYAFGRQRILCHHGVPRIESKLTPLRSAPEPDGRQQRCPSECHPRGP